MSGRYTRLLIALAALPLCLPGLAAHAASPALRICADPDDLPFSSNAAQGSAGLYVEYGRRIAQQLDRPYEAVWVVSNFGKRAVRTELLAGKCDAWVGLPGDPDFMGPKVIFSKPFGTIGYALVVEPGTRIGRMDDLKGRRVAVQFASGPQSLLAERGGIESMTVLDPNAAMQALAEHKVDAAFIWGPVAGYLNASKYDGRYQVVPVAGAGLQFPVAIGFRKGSEALRDQVDQAVDQLRGDFAGLAASYGLPTATPIQLASLDQGAERVAPRRRSFGRFPVAAVAMPEGMVRVDAPADDPAVAAGREVFNGTCGHCHGPDAVQSERKINLRLLRHRYGDQMDEVFHTTVTHGRPDKGMPNWSEVFTEDDFAKILAFLHTVQEK